ncbi:MAG: carbonic anhydrase [Bacteroidales bacterium]|nr:carbonic anhydrase [Bacteroidales bacterium]
MREKLIALRTIEDVPVQYRNGPISRLIEYHNFKRPFDSYNKAELLIGMCMDNRKQMTIPDKFSYIIRTGGANLRYSEFKVSFAVAIGSIQHIALIGHNHCGMVNLHSKKEDFIDGLVDVAGWDRNLAEEQFTHFSPMFEISNEVDFTLSEVVRLRNKYPKITIAPMMYLVEDNQLYLIDEDKI